MSADQPRSGFGGMLLRAALAPAVLAVPVTAACGVAALALPGGRPLVLHAYLAAIGVLGVWAGAALLRAVLPAAPSALERALPRPAPPLPQVAELARMERDVAFATSTEFDFHVRLRRHLREIAVARLRTGRGVDPERDPAAARRALGASWDALDAGPPTDRRAPGPSLAELRRHVDALEEL